jgi:hypothetical protein
LAGDFLVDLKFSAGLEMFHWAYQKISNLLNSNWNKTTGTSPVDRKMSSGVFLHSFQSVIGEIPWNIKKSVNSFENTGESVMIIIE